MATKYTVEPVTRIEGHAKITCLVNDAGQVERARFHVVEFRGFEKFCEGRHFSEMPTLTERICGICPVSHHLASAKAIDILADAKPTRTASLLRRADAYGSSDPVARAELLPSLGAGPAARAR